MENPWTKQWERKQSVKGEREEARETLVLGREGGQKWRRQIREEWGKLARER